MIAWSQIRDGLKNPNTRAGLQEFDGELWGFIHPAADSAADLREEIESEGHVFHISHQRSVDSLAGYAEAWERARGH